MNPTFTLITLDTDSEPYFVVFVNENKFIEGDYYDDKLYEKLQSIEEYLKFIGEKFINKNISFKALKGSYYDYDYQPKIDETLEKYVERIEKIFIIVK